MSQKTIDDDLLPLTLSNAAGGELEAQFQERLFEVLDALGDFRRLLPDADGRYRCQIKLEVVVAFDPNDGTYTHEARALHPTKPKPSWSERDAYRRGQEIKVLPDMKQEAIPGTGSTS